MQPRYFQGISVTGQVSATALRTFKEVVAAIRKPVNLGISRKAWDALPQAERDRRKHTPYFVPAVFKSSPCKRNYENAVCCNLLFLDIDALPDGTCPAAEFIANPGLLRERLPGFNFIAHTTASSTPERPRARIIIDAEGIPPSLYAKAIIDVGTRLKLPVITKESKVAVQAMFRPICFTDSVPDENIIDIQVEVQPYTPADIPGNQGAAPSANGSNGSNGHTPDLHAPAEPPEVDELENLVAPDPDYTLDVVRGMLDAIDADCPREQWIRVAAAMRHQFSPHQDKEASELFVEWSRTGELMFTSEADSLYCWNSFKQTSKGRPPVTIRSLVQMAEKAGWKNPVKALKIKQEKNYYDSAKKEFLVKNEGGRWLPHGTEGFKRHLRSKGFSTKVPEGERLSPAEQVMEDAINQRDVRYSGPLAGRKAGFYDEGGVRFLVTESPCLPEPQHGEAPIICGLMNSLFNHGPHGERQHATAMGWLKVGYESLRAGERQDGQALALAGPVGCGKSLFQSVVTLVLGGRSAKAMRYMSGQTPFNSELFGAEHLMLEDESSSTDIRARMSMAAKIKEVTVNASHSCHAKHRDAVTLCPLWRMSISLNDEAEAMLVLPPMREDIVAKIILLQCAAPATPFPTGDHALHAAYWQKIVNEIPAFVQMLIDYEIPAHLRDTRFGVRYFHHPDLVENLLSLAPETKLLELIDRAIFTERKTPWEGTAGDLESLLRNQFSGVHEEASRLLQWTTACGVYLGKLIKPDGRVSEKRNRKGRVWTILPPLPEINLDEY